MSKYCDILTKCLHPDMVACRDADASKKCHQPAIISFSECILIVVFHAVLDNAMKPLSTLQACQGRKWMKLNVDAIVELVQFISNTKVPPTMTSLYGSSMTKNKVV